MNYERIKQIGIRAAYRGGDILRRHFGNLFEIRKKGTIDLVTTADIESEQAITETIRSAFPDHSILAEEAGRVEGHSEMCWVIDPLDGTTNFAHGLGIFAVSIAFEHKGTPVFGIVFNPVSGETFTALAGQGAFLNSQPISVSSTATVGDSLLVTGFPYDLARMPADIFNRFERCLSNAQGIRRLGSAALDLCYVACGRFDGFWEENLKPWDTAAGMVVALEAGGRITDFGEQPYNINQNQILATNGHIHSEMCTLLNIEANACRKI
jgi:myo-inositol-1(or 4)-monophosphatase